MKKIVLSALLLALGATATAQAQTTYATPQFGKIYQCTYDATYSGPAASPGAVWWQQRTGTTPTMLYTFENFQLDAGGWENYKLTWAKPAKDPVTGFTIWEATFVGGPQCTRTAITPSGFTISFRGCSDGHTRSCFTQ